MKYKANEREINYLKHNGDNKERRGRRLFLRQADSAKNTRGWRKAIPQTGLATNPGVLVPSH